MADVNETTAQSELFASLLGLIDPKRPMLVQTHDYPDIDAVASAWALSELLELHGIHSVSVYRGEIRNRSLSRLVTELKIRIFSAPSYAEKARISSSSTAVPPTATWIFSKAICSGSSIIIEKSSSPTRPLSTYVPKWPHARRSYDRTGTK